jgi:hypothetical protein
MAFALERVFAHEPDSAINPHRSVAYRIPAYNTGRVPGRRYDGGKLLFLKPPTFTMDCSFS